MFSAVTAQAITRAQATKHSLTHKGAGERRKRVGLLRRVFCAVAERLRRAEIELGHYRPLYNDVRGSTRMEKR